MEKVPSSRELAEEDPDETNLMNAEAIGKLFLVATGGGNSKIL